MIITTQTETKKKSLLGRARVILTTMLDTPFLNFTENVKKFKAMSSLDFNYQTMADFNKIIIAFKNVKLRERKSDIKQIMENVEKLYRNYYNVYQDHYDREDAKDKKKTFNYK